MHLISSVVWMHSVAGVGTTSRLTALIQMHPTSQGTPHDGERDEQQQRQRGEEPGAQRDADHANIERDAAGTIVRITIASSEKNRPELVQTWPRCMSNSCG